MKKKAITTSVIMYVVLALFVLFVIIIFIGTVKEGQEKLLTKETCKRSVETISATKLRVKGFQLFDKFGSPQTLNCATQYLTAGAGQEKKVLANAMFDCWDEFGQGKKEIFDTAKGNYCVVCSRVEFTNKGEVTEFTKYLIETKIPGTEKTYFNYLNNVEMKNANLIAEYENSNLKGKDNIDTTKPIAVVFVMAKTPTNSWWQGSVIGALVGGTIVIGSIVLLPFTGGASSVLTSVGLILIGGGAAVGGTAGYFTGSAHGVTDWGASLLIWPYDDLNKLDKCTVLEGQATPLSTASFSVKDDNDPTEIDPSEEGADYTVQVGSQSQIGAQQSGAQQGGSQTGNSGLNKKLICVNAGHSKTSGAVASDGTTERDLNLQVAKKLKTALLAKGYQVYMTREGQAYTDVRITQCDPYERIAMNEQKCGVAINVHHDSANVPAGTGIFICDTNRPVRTIKNPDTCTNPSYTESGSYQVTENGDTELAKAIKNQLSWRTPTAIRPDTQANVVATGASSLGVLCRTDMPSVLIEIGSVGGTDLAKVKDNQFQEKMAESIAEGIKQYLGTP